MSEQNIEYGNTSSGFQPPSPRSGEGAFPDRGGEGASRTGDDGAAGVARPALRLPPVKQIPRERMTVRQLMDAQRDHQAGIALECEVQRQARELGLDAAAARQLGEQARAGFRIVQGEPVPVAGDRQTVLLAADGVNVLSVTEWVARQVRGQKAEAGSQPRGEDGRWTMEDGEEVLPMRNPFRRKTWNLTEQMRLQRRDPRLAKRLKAEAWAEGE